jgi:superfamily II DNA helicase RecQ
LGILKDHFPRVPTLALTATATEKVKVDIVHQLKMKLPYLFLCSFNRPNLLYKVIETPKNKKVEEIA